MDSVGGVVTDRAIVVILTDGTQFEVQGASWTEPPLFTPVGGSIPGVLQNTEIEISREEAHESRRELEYLHSTRKPLVIGRDWRYTPLDTESMFVVIRDSAAQKVGSFNPDEVAAVYFKGEAELIDA